MLIHPDSTFLLIWSPIETITCLVSSIVYAWTMAFTPSDTFYQTEIIFEAIMLISFILKFFTMYFEQGAAQPTKEIGKIS